MKKEIVLKNKIDDMSIKKNRGRKEQHCLMFHKDTWQSINESSKLYGMSASEYLEKLQELYLETNNKN